jgi:8-oxo-dGTP diphosphatase
MAERGGYREVTRAIIVDTKRRALLGKRAGGIGAGQWALFGGKPDDGEHKIAAVIREVREEIGLDFAPDFYLTMLDDVTDPEKPWLVTFYTGQAIGVIVIKEDEISEVGYFSREEIEELDIAFDHKERLLDFFDQDYSSY